MVGRSRSPESSYDFWNLGGNTAALAHMERLKAYYDDPAAAPHENPPTPPTPEIACELTASIAQLVAIAIDFERTGQVNMSRRWRPR